MDRCNVPPDKREWPLTTKEYKSLLKRLNDFDFEIYYKSGGAMIMGAKVKITDADDQEAVRYNALRDELDERRPFKYSQQ